MNRPPDSSTPTPTISNNTATLFVPVMANPTTPLLPAASPFLTRERQTILKKACAALIIILLIAFEIGLGVTGFSDNTDDAATERGVFFLGLLILGGFLTAIMRSGYFGETCRESCNDVFGCSSQP